MKICLNLLRQFIKTMCPDLLGQFVYIYQDNLSKSIKTICLNLLRQLV